MGRYSRDHVSVWIHDTEEKGFIRRERNEIDRRSLRVYLTLEGKRLADSVIPLVNEFNNLLIRGFSDGELVVLKTMLSKIRTNID